MRGWDFTETRSTQMIIDTHAHIYPDKIAEKATKSIQEFYNITTGGIGSVGNLLKIGDEAGIDKFLVHSVATTEKQVESINNFIIQSVNAHPDRFFGFGTLHPDFVNPGREVDRIISEGLCGIKLHPDFQKFNIDDPSVYNIYEAAEGRVPILFHMGDERYDFSRAERLRDMLKSFPGLTVIAAHMGGWSDWDHASSVLCDTGVYADTSSSFRYLTPEHSRELIYKYGPERVLFACDFPMWNPKEELEIFNRIELPDTDRELILGKNAEKLFHLN